MDKKRKEKMNMKLAEKIFNERKKLSFSQEQFAERMEVSRQAVSKWESGQSMPDLDKIILMSNLFGVSTDYLLKEDSVSPVEDGTQGALKNDRMDSNQSVKEENYVEESLRTLGEAEVSKFMQVRGKAGIQITMGVVLCVLGVVLCMGMEMIGILTGCSEELTDLLSSFNK